MAIDYVTLFAEPYDPCVVLATLRPVYFQMVIEGAGTAEITFRDRTVKFHKVDVKAFEALIKQLQSECRAAGGLSTGRAITAGYRNTWGDG